MLYQEGRKYTSQDVVSVMEDLVDSGSDCEETHIGILHCTKYMEVDAIHVQAKNSLFLAILTAIKYLQGRASFIGNNPIDSFVD